jgi:sugar phosphate isomerase/epimerase
MRLAAITDEFSSDLHVALDAMQTAAITGVELRIVNGRNIIEFTDEQAHEVRCTIEDCGMQIVSMASPLLKWVLPGGPPIDARLQQDVFGSRYTAEDHPRLTERAFALAGCLGAPLVRVFSFWRTATPGACEGRVAEALHALAEQAADCGVVVGLENEHACNVGTGAETARVLGRVPHPALQIVWDPANALVLGERPFPEGYAALPSSRIAHVHAKDCIVHGFVPEWGPIGEMGMQWREQINALHRDGFRGWVSLETHWTGPRGDKLEASAICARTLQTMIAAASS